MGPAAAGPLGSFVNWAPASNLKSRGCVSIDRARRLGPEREGEEREREEREREERETGEREREREREGRGGEVRVKEERRASLRLSLALREREGQSPPAYLCRASARRRQTQRTRPHARTHCARAWARALPHRQCARNKWIFHARTHARTHGHIHARAHTHPHSPAPPRTPSGLIRGSI